MGYEDKYDYLSEDPSLATPPPQDEPLDRDALIEKYLQSKLGRQPEEDLEGLRNKQNANVQLQRDSATTNLMAGLNNASAMFSGGRAKADNSDLEASNKDRMEQIATSNQQMAAGAKQVGEEREKAVHEYLSGKREDARLSQSAANNKATNDRIREDSKNAGELREHLAKIYAQAGAGRADAKHDQKDNADFVQLGRDLNFGPTRGGQDYQAHKKIVSSADRILGLGKQGDSQKGGLDSRQIHEIAIASAALVGGSTGAAQGTIDALVPHSVDKTAAGIEEWLSGEPTGTNQMEFVKRMLDTAKREKHIAQEKIKGYDAGTLDTYSHLADSNPEKYNALKLKKLGPDAKFDENGNYIQKDYAPEDNSMVYIANPDNPTDIQAVPASKKDYYLKKGGKLVDKPVVAK